MRRSSSATVTILVSGRSFLSCCFFAVSEIFSVFISFCFTHRPVVARGTSVAKSGHGGDSGASSAVLCLLQCVLLAAVALCLRCRCVWLLSNATFSGTDGEEGTTADEGSSYVVDVLVREVGVRWACAVADVNYGLLQT